MREQWRNEDLLPEAGYYWTAPWMVIAALDNEAAPASTVFVLVSESSGIAGRVVVGLDGRTGEEVFRRVGYWHDRSAMVVGDVDRDGQQEIVVTQLTPGPADGSTSPTLALVAFDAVSGERRWTSEPISSGSWSRSLSGDWRLSLPSFHIPRLTDLEGDGDVEIVFRGAIVDGTHGRLLHEGVNNLFEPLYGDLDRDGSREVFFDRYVDNLATLEQISPEFRATNINQLLVGATRLINIPLDVDDGGCASVVSWIRRVVDIHLQVLSCEGTERSYVRLKSEEGYPVGATSGPAVADIFARGRSDVVYNAHLWEPTGFGDPRPLGRLCTGLSSPMRCRDLGLGRAIGTPMSALDFDGDGAQELVSLVQRPVTPGELTPVDGSVVIHSAEEILTEHPVHTGRGWEDGVFVADVDADGAAEIVAPASRRVEGEGVRKGVVVLEHDGTGWKGAGPHWPQSPFRPGEILPDGTVTAPGVVELSLARGAMVNARPITEPTHELSLELAGSCAASCAGEVRAVVRVSNHGVAYLREGDAELVVRGTEPGAIVARAAVPPTDPGDISADVEVVLPRTADLPTANEVRIELRLPDGVSQCSAEEDVVTVTLPPECATLR